VKTSLDAGENQVSNKVDKNIPSHLNILIITLICAIALLIVLNFSEKIKQLIPRIPFSLSDQVSSRDERTVNIFSPSPVLIR